MFNIDTILNNADLRQLVERAGSQPGNHGNCACPLHGGESENGFSIFHKDGRDYWKCWSADCGAGDAITFVQKWMNMDFKHACAFLGGDIISDPVAMQASAKARHEAAILETIAAQEKQEARRKELQVSELHLHYHEQMKDWGRLAWLDRGIDEMYQGLWYLGACDDKTIMYKGVEYHTPTLTIPIMSKDFSVLNIKHRLINPPKSNDKYRPEREGLGMFPPFLAYPELGYDASVTWVIEGEIKAMVTATITPDVAWQFIGVPGKNGFDKLADQLKGTNVIVVPDPGSEKEAYQLAKKINAKWLVLPEKIDDYIIKNESNQNHLNAWYKQAMRIK